jgi:hypothetical protein
MCGTCDVNSVMEGHNFCADHEISKVHLNYPNFDMGLMTYSGYKDEKRKIPDLTVGLLVSSKRYWHAPPGMTTTEFAKIMDHQLVKPFFHDVFDKLEKDGSIKPLFAFSGPRKGNHTSRTSKSSINFPFMIWEAKKAGEGEPVGQNALKVRMVLGWQRNLAKRTNTAWTPLVYHIVSVGSELKLYACYVPRSSAGEKDTYVSSRDKSSYTHTTESIQVFQMLWSGDCVNPAEALQLLYLIDIIALWGQFQYKPFAAACIQILKTKQEGNRGLRLSDAKPLQFSKAINAWEFPSLQFDGLPLIASPGSPFGLRRAGTKTSVSELADQLRRGMRLHDPRNYFIPERDAYIWLLHRELRGADLLVVRVNIEGCVLPPLVIFESAYGSSPDFRYIIEQERLRMPKNVEVEFRYDKNRTSFLQKCFSIDKGQCTKSEIQFCAILPLRKRGTGQGDADTRTEFHPLEQLLGLQTLINAAQSTNKLWCTCQGLETEDMVLCDSTNCAYLWYHMDCENVSEVNSAQPWFCRACKQGGNIKLSSYDDDKNFEDGIVKASDKRIQRVRSLSRAWSNHEWPDPSKVRKLMYKKICCEIEMETRERKFQDTVEVLEAERASSAIQSRAIIRADPLRMTKIKQRFRAKSVPR